MCNKKDQNGKIYSLLSSSARYKNQERTLLDIQNLHNHLLNQAIEWWMEMKGHLASLLFESNLIMQPLLTGFQLCYMTTICDYDLRKKYLMTIV